jgi:hypothetical protein
MKTLKYNHPWTHWISDDFLSPECLAELMSVDHAGSQPLPGRRVGGDRIFIGPEHAEQHPHMHRLWQELHTGDIKRYFESHTGLDYTNLYPRVEVISDQGDFYLERHHDMLEKRLTALVYTDHAQLYPGTMLEGGYQVESRDNRCMFFVPSNNTWHSYPLTHFATVRRAMQINYWTEISPVGP